MTTETELVRAAQAGKRDAFDRLVVDHAPAVIRGVYVIVGDRDEAEDVAQEAFIAAYRGLASYRFDAPFGAWLRRIAVNRAYDHLRRRQRQRVLVEDIKAVSPPSEEEDALRHARASEQTAAVRALIATLDEKNRAIVSMRFLDGMAIQDIALALDMPEGTIKRRLHEVLKVLRTRVTEGALQ